MGAFLHGGQRGWSHDEGHAAGVFDTYDRFEAGGPPRKIHVLVPRSGSPGCPVVVFHDGDTTFWPGGFARATWDVAGTLSALGERVEPVLAVAVHAIDRDREYTHVDWSGGRFPWGGLPAHARWLAEVLVPWVLGQYRADPGRVFVVGSSHGGLASFWTATRHPTVFRGAGCLSPSLFSGLDDLGTGRRGPTLLERAPLVAEVADTLARRGERPRLWLDWGTRRDGGPHNAIVEALAAERGRELAGLLVDRFGYRPGDDLWAVEDPGAGHDEAAWGRRFGDLARTWLARPRT